MSMGLCVWSKGGGERALVRGKEGGRGERGREKEGVTNFSLINSNLYAVILSLVVL